MRKLRPRERELAKLLISGLTLKEAGYRMGFKSRGVAANYAFRARHRLGCQTVFQMMYELGRENGTRQG